MAECGSDMMLWLLKLGMLLSILYVLPDWRLGWMLMLQMLLYCVLLLLLKVLMLLLLLLLLKVMLLLKVLLVLLGYVGVEVRHMRRVWGGVALRVLDNGR